MLKQDTVVVFCLRQEETNKGDFVTNKGAFVCLSTPLRERVAHRVCLSERGRERTCERENKKIENSPISERVSL